jgi:tetratricopeptide (TPR) repeat protein
MDYNEVRHIRQDILAHLAKNEVKEGCALLLKLAVNLRDWHITEKLGELEVNYKYMLNYQFDGVDDPHREELFHRIMRTLYELTDDAADELMNLDSPGMFYEKFRLESFRNQPTLPEYQSALKELEGGFSLAELIEDKDDKVAKLKYLAVKKERVATDMFNSIFVSSRISEEQQLLYLDFVRSDEVSVTNKCLFVSALTLNLLHRFDSRKISVLLFACALEDPQIRGRAIVGLVFVLMKYDKRWQYYDECRKQLEDLNENVTFRKSFETVLIQLIRSKETESISRKMMDEIIPEMMKFSSKAGRKLSIEDFSGDGDLSDKNPDWKKDLESSGLANKLQEYSELHLEGADVFHSTFANLKSFPFFRELSSWFLPFEATYSQLIDLTAGNKNNILLTAVSKSGYMCDSDKYSFCLSLLQIPEQQHQMIALRLGEEASELEKLQKEEMLFNPRVSDEIVSNQYIQNLYRFFKLYPRRSDFEDVFDFGVNFYKYQSLKPLIMSPAIMNRLALYCFDKNHFAEAESIYALLAHQSEQISDEWWQKIGYCKQMLTDIGGAVEAYKQADLINSANSWTIKRIAHCYRLLKKPEIALEYFKRAEQLQPENMSIQMNIGHCYLEMEDYIVALNHYFKVEFSDTSSNKPQRPIAWTAFLAGKLDLSESYYQQLIADKPSVHDYLNLGHIYLRTNRLSGAIESYLQSLRLAGSFDLFLKYFREDEDVLFKVGVSPETVSRLLDQIRYKHEGGL